MTNLPPGFARTVTGIFGADGQRFLDELPTILGACVARWSLRLGPHFPDLSINYVAPATLPDGGEVVLKVCVPNREFVTEAAALRHFSGRGAVRLLACDMEAGALLLERPRPGTAIWEENEDQAVEAALTVMQRLWREPPPDRPFPTVAEWAMGLRRMRARFDGGTGPLPEDLVRMAEAYFAELLGADAGSVVLHGDLHHGNILRTGDDTVAIDPKGVIGEPAFEVTAFMLNPDMSALADSEVAARLARRLDRFAAGLSYDRERLRRWCVARAVLSAWWSVEDHGEWDGALRVARILSAL